MMTEDDVAMELVDMIDKHQAHRFSDEFTDCCECGLPWPCWTVRVAHHTYGLGRVAGHVEAALYAFPGDTKDARQRRLLTIVMTPEHEPPPFPSLDPVKALAEPTAAR